jgi:hypothetical protein
MAETESWSAPERERGVYPIGSSSGGKGVEERKKQKEKEEGKQEDRFLAVGASGR